MYTLHIKDYFTSANTEDIGRTELESPLGVEAANEPLLPPGSRLIDVTLRRTSAELPRENDMHVPDGLSRPPSEVPASGNIVPQETASADRINNHRRESTSSSTSSGSLSLTNYRDIEICPVCGNAVQHNQQWFTATTNRENGNLCGRILYCSEQCAESVREDNEVVRPIRFLFKYCAVCKEDIIWMPVAVCNECHNYTCYDCFTQISGSPKGCPHCRFKLHELVNLMRLQDTSQIQEPNAIDNSSSGNALDPFMCDDSLDLATPSNPPDVASLTMDEGTEQIRDDSGDAIEVNQQDDDTRANQDDDIVHHAENPGNTDLANPDDDGFEDDEGNEDN